MTTTSTVPTRAATPIRCKLCGGMAPLRFTVPLAHDLTGQYFECASCGFLHSPHLDDPQALSRVYAQARADDDPGAAFRLAAVANRLATLARARAFGAGPLAALDFGTGSGFLPGFLAMRAGWKARGFDAYATPTYTPSLVTREWRDIEAAAPFTVVTAIEVVEHFTNPREQFAQLRSVMDSERSFLYVTTELADRRTHDWTYLAPHTAQHCSFYSRRSLEIVRDILGASQVLQAGGSNEWVFVRGSGSRAWLRAALALTRILTRLTLSYRFDR